MTMAEAAAVGALFITATGNKNVISREHLERMKDGALVANSGHFNVEIDIPSLEKMAKNRRMIRASVEEFRRPGGRRIYLLGEGPLVTLACAEGHPAMVMDMSFANQALCAEYLAKNASRLEKKVYPVPQEIDQAIARIKLDSMGVRIDGLTTEQ